MNRALGLIEVLGLTAAMTALDAAIKAADVTFLGKEKVIGVGKAISLTLRIEGEVAAVQAAVGQAPKKTLLPRVQPQTGLRGGPQFRPQLGAGSPGA